jgi:hypothetical protein
LGGVKACSYCGRNNEEEAQWCFECGTALPIAEAAKEQEETPEPPTAELAQLGMGFEMAEGFSRPNWKQIHDFVKKKVPKKDWEKAWEYVAEKWLHELAQDLGGAARIHRSGNFLCLSDLRSAAAQATVAYAERVVKLVRDTLKEAAWHGFSGKHVLLVFSDQDDYYSYVSYYLKEGRHPLSGGVFLTGGYAHVAFPYVNARASEHVLVHELTHNLLCHLRIPTWLNEGLAVLIERLASLRPFLLDKELVERHYAHWNEKNIQSFWAGTSYHIPGDDNELSYGLAEIFVNLLLGKGQEFVTFILKADWRDGGQDAALTIFGKGLEEVAGEFLGPGDWRPQRKAIADLWKAREVKGIDEAVEETEEKR